ncbi:MAG TPA: methyltransferase domain-containing protein [Candidatus Limnocylindria bacterium]
MSESATPAASAIFDATAEGYAATMAPSLRPVAAEVVRRARLHAGEKVLDVGCGTGIAAAAAQAAGAAVIGLDGAPGMVAVARREVPGVDFRVGDFMALPFDDGAFNVVISSHALLFADDRVGALREWRRVCRRGGRLSLSVPGPDERTPGMLYGEVYRRHGVATTFDYPVAADLGGWAREAGWTGAAVAEDPTVAIYLPDAEAFSAWRRTGSRGAATAGWSEERHAVLTADMLAVTPRDPEGSYAIPFGAIYLIAGN